MAESPEIEPGLTLELQREKLLLEREKATDERQFREREFALREREQALKEQEQRRSRLTSPIVLAVLAAAVAAGGNAVVAYINGSAQSRLEKTKALTQHRLEQSKADASLILEVIKTNNDTEKARGNLSFLVTTGLISDDRRRTELAAFLNDPNAGQVPSLPLAAPPQPIHTSSARCSFPSDTDLGKLADALESRMRQENGEAVTVSRSPQVVRLSGIFDRGAVRISFTVEKGEKGLEVVMTRASPNPVAVIGPSDLALMASELESFVNVRPSCRAV